MHETAADSRYRATLDNLIEGFQIISRDWRYLYVNPAAAAQGRSTPDALHGRLMQDAYPGIEQSPLFETMRACMATRTAASLENLFTYPDGTQRWFELRIEPVPEGVCIQSVDIHARKQAQEVLERQNEMLEARVAARTRELEALNTELGAFAYSVSHDLRAPLRHISGFADILLASAPERLDAEDRDCLDRIARAAKRLSTMIDNLLDFSRLGARPVAKRRVPLEHVVEDARADVAPDAAGRDVAWSLGALPELDLDPALARLAFVNLFSNALKFTRGRARAEIGIDATYDDAAGEWIVAVRDNGAGFDAGSASRLFGVFQRLHTEAEFEGTGIGLANVRRIVARHGGRTWAEGAPDQGATFFVAFPASDADATDLTAA